MKNKFFKKIRIQINPPRFLFRPGGKRVPKSLASYAFMALMAAGFLLATFIICLMDKDNRVTIITNTQLPLGSASRSAGGVDMLFYVMLQRCGPFIIVALASFTIFGIAASLIYALWIGAALGVVNACLVLTYGLRGIPLFFMLIMPHFLLIIPLAATFLRHCFEICALLYFKKTERCEAPYNKKQLILKQVLILLALMLGFMSTSVLEIYVNNIFLKNTGNF